jgi:hypothetical protein
LSESRKLLLAVGSGLEISVPEGVTLLPVEGPVEPGPTIGELQQQEIVRAALAKPESGPPLAELAREKRRVVILAGDLSRPAPYDIALPPVMAALVEAGIRPSRVAVLVCPGAGVPVLGRGAIHRYGEEIVGDHELRVWQGGENGEPDPYYAAADLRVAVSPLPFPAQFKSEFAVELGLGKKARIDIVSARTNAKISNAQPTAIADAEVFLTSGGGGDWEATFEEALLSLWPAAPSNKEPRTAVLAFSGEEGLGSAHFTRDLWALLEQAEEFVDGGGALEGSTPRPDVYDPAATLAFALSSHAHVVLFSTKISEHSEGDELAERIAALPNMSQRLGLVTRESDLWPLLERSHGAAYRLDARPLGWRQ